MYRFVLYIACGDEFHEKSQTNLIFFKFHIYCNLTFEKKLKRTRNNPIVPFIRAVLSTITKKLNRTKSMVPGSLERLLVTCTRYIAR